MFLKDKNDFTVTKADTLTTSRTINGTSFNGSANITTSNWGTARNITVADSDGTNTGSAVSVNGSANVTLKLPATIKASLSGNASTSTKATQDSAGQQINTTYIKGLSVSGKTITYTKGDGSTGTITTQDTNTTYSTGTASTLGLTKLYTGTGTATDGTMTQAAINTALSGKANSSHGRHIPDACATITDWNSATTTGWYMGNNVANAPTSGSNVWYFGEVVAHNTNYVLQTVYYFTASSDAKAIPKYIRAKTNGTWGAWTNVTVAKAVPSNAVFTDTNTWRGVQDNLTSTATDQSLSANQGKVLKGLVDGKANSSHTHNYAGSSSAGGNANAAVKLATARTINGTNFDGTANITTANWGTSRKINNISVNGSADVKLPLDHYTCSVSNDNTNLYHHILSSGQCTGDYTDKSITVLLVNHYNSSGFGIAKITLRTNQASAGATATGEIQWLVRSGFSANQLCFNIRNTAKDTYMDVFYKSSGTYNSLTWYVLSEGARGNHSSQWTKNNTNASGTNAYTEATMKTIRSYTSTLVSAAETGVTNYSNSAGYLSTARTINGTSFNGSANITTTNWGTARTLTIGSTGKSVNGSGNVSWSLAEIGAAAASHGNHVPATETANARKFLRNDNTWQTLPSASTSATGIVQLNNTTTSTSTTQAATANAAKLAYDKGVEALNKANEALQSGNNVKQQLVDALIAKDIEVSTSDTWDKLIENINKLVNTAPSFGANGEWSVITDGMQLSRFDSGVAILDNKIYVAGGHNQSTGTSQMECFDLNTGKWSYKASFNSNLWGNRMETINNYIYSFGGTTRTTLSSTSGDRNTQLYDPGTNTWTSKALMPSGAIHFVTAVINNEVYIQGDDYFFKYDPSSNTWTSLANAFRQMSPTLFVGLGNLIYGNTGKYIFTYDIHTGNYTTSAATYPTMYGYYAGASFVHNGNIYCIGGQTSYSGGNMNSNISEKTLYMLDPVTNVWTKLGEASTPRTRMGCVYNNGKAYLVGGHTTTSTLVKNIEAIKF